MYVAIRQPKHEVATVKGLPPDLAPVVGKLGAQVRRSKGGLGDWRDTTISVVMLIGGLAHMLPRSATQ